MRLRYIRGGTSRPLVVFSSGFSPTNSVLKRDPSPADFDIDSAGCHHRGAHRRPRIPRMWSRTSCEERRTLNCARPRSATDRTGRVVLIPPRRSCSRREGRAAANPSIGSMILSTTRSSGRHLQASAIHRGRPMRRGNRLASHFLIDAILLGSSDPPASVHPNSRAPMRLIALLRDLIVIGFDGLAGVLARWSRCSRPLTLAVILTAMTPRFPTCLICTQSVST